MIDYLYIFLIPFFYDYKGFFMRLFDTDDKLCQSFTKWCLNALKLIVALFVLLVVYQFVAKIYYSI